MRRSKPSKIRRRIGHGLDPDGPIELQREAFARLLELTSVGMPEHSCERVELGGVEALRLTPSLVPDGGKGARLFYVHGGGYSLGSPETQRPLAARVAAAIGAPLEMPRYPLAPEHPYPAALEVLRRAWQGLEPEEQRSALMIGDSAGGGLALALAMDLRARGEPGPAGLVLMSPWVDLSVSGDSIERNAAHDLMFSRAGLELMAQRYVGGCEGADPRVSPLFGDFCGLPPTLIQAGAEEMLLDDAVRAAVQAELAGVQVELQVYPGQGHVFQATPMLEAGARALAAIAAWVAERPG